VKEQNVVAWIGIDWADKSHEICEYEVERGKKRIYSVAHGPESLQDWVNELRQRYKGEAVAVVMEQSRGGLIYALMNVEFVHLYPVNPQSLAKYRKALYPSGAKSDPVDAELLEEMVRHNQDRFRDWKPADEQSRSLQLLTEGRRKFVDDMTALTNQLTSALKTYYPQALMWAGELSQEQACAFLEKWPTLMDLQKSRAFRIRQFFEQYGRPRRERLKEKLQQIQTASPLTTDTVVVMAGRMKVETLIGQIRALRTAIEKYEQEIERVFQQHPDKAIFESFPGAGKALAPRLSAAFGADRDRWDTALEIQELSGIAPVTERSGNRIWVHRRWACGKFTLQTFHEFADQTRRFCGWCKAYYEQEKTAGKDHHAILRALAYKWIRIMFRCWKDRQPYDEARYLTALAKRGSKLIARLNAVEISPLGRANEA
jgi:transposase